MLIALINSCKLLSTIMAKAKLNYIPFPEVLKGKYQSFTEADTTKLLAAGYDKGFHKMEDAVKEYCELLDNNEGYLR